MEAIGTLAGGIAHDFNNLLQVVLGYTDMLIMNQTQGSPNLRTLKAVRKAAKDGGELVKGLLTFSRQVESSKVPVDLTQQLTQLRKFLGRMIPKTIETELILAPDLATVNADRIQLDQVLINLAINAYHAMPKGGKLTVEARNVILDEDYCLANVEARPGDYVMLKISDTGHGMDKDVVDHIFEPFFTTKEAGKGTGLGLAIVYGIVKNHDGHITCSSEPGQGTTFKIYLPTTPRKYKTEMATTYGEITAFGTETILLVDDEELITDAFESILTDRGYKVFRAENGNAALEIYQEKKDEIDLVVLDLNMPGISGRECLEGILKINPKAKVLIASGHLEKESTRQIMEVGASGFISKPFEAKDLLRAVRSALDEGSPSVSPVRGPGPDSVKGDEDAGTAATATHYLGAASMALEASLSKESPRGLRILAIDDREPYLRMLEAGLAQFGQSLLTASSGIGGLTIFQETPVDLVICDLGMPELDGWKVGKRIKEICEEKEVPKTPFILLTGEANLEDIDQETRQQMADCGVDTIVGKPVDIPDLLEVIAGLMMKRLHGSRD
jgi:CheY-like chemotaxis protein